MDLSTVIMSVVAIVVIFVPFYMLSKSGSKQMRNLLRQYQELGAKYGLTNIESDGWNDMVFGVDKTSRKILFYKNRKGNEEHRLLDLATVASCKKVNVSRSVKVNAGVTNVVDMLGLELSLKNGQPPVLIDFYDSKESFILNNELLLVEKWSKIINELVK